MSAKDDGGPAFPNQHDEHFPSNAEGGMSLRDYFAGQFLAAVHILGDGAPAEAVARNCYAMADAMIAAREKTV